MKKIEVGDYIRLNKGGIHKIKDVKEKYCIDEKGLMIYFEFLQKISGYKVGKTKLELIEKGDYVNGKRVDNVSNGMIALDYCEECSLWGQVIDKDEEIKTVLTKSQYENNCFKEVVYDM